MGRGEDRADLGLRERLVEVLVLVGAVGGRQEDGGDEHLDEGGQDGVEGRGGGQDLAVDPALDADPVLGEDPGLEELVDAVDWEVTGVAGGEVGGHWYLWGERRSRKDIKKNKDQGDQRCRTITLTACAATTDSVNISVVKICLILAMPFVLTVILIPVV